MCVCFGLLCCSSKLVFLTALWSHLTVLKNMPESSAKLIRLRTSGGLQESGGGGRSVTRPIGNRQGMRRLQEGSCCGGLGLGPVGSVLFSPSPLTLLSGTPGVPRCEIGPTHTADCYLRGSCGSPHFPQDPGSSPAQGLFLPRKRPLVLDPTSPLGPLFVAASHPLSAAPRWSRSLESE